MSRFIDKFLNDNIPVDERMFYLATFMSSVASILFVSISAFIQVDIYSVILYAILFVVGVTSFFVESKIHRPRFMSFVFLTIVNVFIFPSIMLFLDCVTVEVALYMLIGIVFSLVLLEGKYRVIQFGIQIIADSIITFYCFILRDYGQTVMGATTASQFIRLEIAIVVSGFICGIIVFYRNSLLEKEMLRMEQTNFQAEQVSYAKDMFLVNVSHEIRTPLNAIIGTTEMLLDSDVSNHIKEMAYNISNSSHALLSITTDLLDFSRMNIDTMHPECEEYDISVMLNDIINLMSVRLLDSNVEFYVNINPELPKTLIGDSGKVRQIIINMLSNAMKYTKEGHMTFTVDFETTHEDEILVHFIVRDTGIGIKEETIEKIFEPYNRSGEMTDRVIEGNGLGLALCKKLSELMDGKIWAESVYGEGSTFFFDVPQKINSGLSKIGTIDDNLSSVCVFTDNKADGDIFDETCKKMGVLCSRIMSDDDFCEAVSAIDYSFCFVDISVYERLKEKLTAASFDFSKLVVISGCNYSYSGEPFEFVLTKPISCLNVSDVMNKTRNFNSRVSSGQGQLSIENANVLVVDDNIINLTVAEGLLEKYNPNVITAASGKDALNILEATDVDIIFLDYMMPDMDGIDTLKAIRALPKEYLKTVPIVSLTANVVSGAKEMFLNAGFDDYLSKPIEIDMLEKVLKEHLNSDLVKMI